MAQLKMGDALHQFLEKSKLKNGIRAIQIENIWEDIMGKTISRYTDKIQIINGTLFIHTSTGPLRQELLYQKEKIIERVNEAFKEKVITNVVVQ